MDMRFTYMREIQQTSSKLRMMMIVVYFIELVLAMNFKSPVSAFSRRSFYRKSVESWMIKRY